MARIKPQALLLQSKKKKGPSSVSVPTIAIYVLVVAVMLFLLATYRHWSRRSMVRAEDSFSAAEGDNVIANTKKSDIPRFAVISTSKGSLTVQLYKEGSPDVVDEFIESCKKGQFRGMQFNRVIKNFVIQGGDVERLGATEDWTARGKHYGHDTRFVLSAISLYA